MHWTALDMRQYGCTHQALTFTNTLRAQTKQERSTQLRNGRILRSVTVSKFQQIGGLEEDRHRNREDGA
jgi:hypothetical protein